MHDAVGRWLESIVNDDSNEMIGQFVDEPNFYVDTYNSWLTI